MAIIEKHFNKTASSKEDKANRNQYETEMKYMKDAKTWNNDYL